MAPHTLRWPETENLGRDVLDCLGTALQELQQEPDLQRLSSRAQSGIDTLVAWLDSPCVATAKLDGTNLGVDDEGAIWGRNHEVPRGDSYCKVDVWKLLPGMPSKVAQVRDELAKAAGEHGGKIQRAMLYGELLINSKYDYGKSGIQNRWLCFGLLLGPKCVEGQELGLLHRCRCCVGLGTLAGYGCCPLCDGAGFFADDSDEAAETKLALALRIAGFNARPKGSKVLVAPSERLFHLLHQFHVPTVVEGYRPHSLTAQEWQEHEGSGNLASFHSMRALLSSCWAQRFLMPENGAALGEGIVVASEADGRLFKWKQASETSTMLTARLAEAVAGVRALKHAAQAKLPTGIVEVLELLLRATVKSEIITKRSPKAVVQALDPDAQAALESALTKCDLEAAFSNGTRAEIAEELVVQVAADLVKEYEVESAEAKLRATQVVRREVGRLLGIWMKTQGKAMPKAE